MQIGSFTLKRNFVLFVAILRVLSPYLNNETLPGSRHQITSNPALSLRK